MSERRRKTLSPSLFPFLAVLVCTLGTLILLLALVAQTATESAAQAARVQQLARQQATEEKDQDDSQPPPLEASVVAEMIEEEQFRASQLVAFRDKQTGDVEQRRDQLTHLEDHVDRLRRRLKLLEDEVRQATGDAPTNVIDQSAIDRLQEEIAAHELAISELRKAAESKTPRIVIVPHQGPNGTDRRPVYVECTANGVTIWPEGSRISTLQLSDSFADANPLDAALRAVRFHAMQNYGDTTPPYPLLVVRPNGIETYAAARGAMMDWDDQFGYELVPADVKLAFPQPDPNLKDRIDLAIRQAAVKQHARHAIARRSLSGRRKLPTLSAASLDRQGRAGGFRSHRDHYQPRRQQSPNYGKRIQASGSGYTPSSGYSAAQSGLGQSGSGYPDSNNETIRRLDDHLRTAAEAIRNEGGAGSRFSPEPSTSGAFAESGSGNGSSAITDSGARADSGARPDSGARADLGTSRPTGGGYQRANDLTGDGKPSSQPGELAGPQPTPSGDVELGQQTQTGGEEELAAQPGQSNSGQATGDGGHNPTGGAAIPPPLANHLNPMHTAAGNPISGMPGEQQQQAPGEDQPQQPPTPSVTIQANRDLVRRQGRDWALPKSIAGAYGNKIVRTIRVQCYEDRFVLLPSGDDATEMFGFSDGQIQRATLELATAVRDRIERWGAAIPGGRWYPRLDVEVMPHGEARFHQLRTLMNGSGVEVQGRAAR